MFDTELLLRKTGDLTADEQAASWIDFGGPDIQPMTYDVVVPKADGTSPTLDIIIQTSLTDGGGVLDTFTLPQIDAIGVYRITFKSPHRWRRMYATVGGTSPDFGLVVIGPQMGGEYTEF